MFACTIFVRTIFVRESFGTFARVQKYKDKTENTNSTPKDHFISGIVKISFISVE